jgi:hypothetical protein
MKTVVALLICLVILFAAVPVFACSTQQAPSGHAWGWHHGWAKGGGTTPGTPPAPPPMSGGGKGNGSGGK